MHLFSIYLGQIKVSFYFYALQFSNDSITICFFLCLLQFSTVRTGGLIVGYASLFLGLFIVIGCLFERKDQKDSLYASISSESSFICIESLQNVPMCDNSQATIIIILNDNKLI